MRHLRRLPSSLMLLMAAGAAAPTVRADELKAMLDTTSTTKLLDTHFGRYGYSPAQSMIRAEQAVRFQLPADTDGVVQTGLYSYFALAGDFELTATYEIIAVPAPETGYGAGVGIAVEGKQAAESVALSWRHVPKRGITYAVTHGPKHETTYHATRAESGRLALHRKGKELICLAADGDAATFQELSRVPFTSGTVRTFRIFADPGGSPSPASVEAQIGNVRVRAAEITGGIPKLERSGGLGWWLALAAVAAAIALFIFWRKRRDAD